MTVGRIGLELNVRMIGLNIQTRFLSIQPSKFPSSQSTIVLVQNMHFSYLAFPSFLQKPDGPMLQNFLCIYDASLCWNYFFQSYRLHFFIKVSIDRFLLMSSFQMLEYCIILLSTETRLAETARVCICVFQLIYLQNYPLDFFQPGLSGQFSLCKKLLDRHIGK